MGYIWEVFLRKYHWEESCRRRVLQREVTTGTWQGLRVEWAGVQKYKTFGETHK